MRKKYLVIGVMSAFLLISGMLIDADIQKKTNKNITLSVQNNREEKLMVGNYIRYHYRYMNSNSAERELSTYADVALRRNKQGGVPCLNANVSMELNNQKYKLRNQYEGHYSVNFGAQKIRGNSMIKLNIAYPSILPGHPPNIIEGSLKVEKTISFKKPDRDSIIIKKNGLLVEWDPSVSESSIELVNESLGSRSHFFPVTGTQYLIPAKFFHNGSVFRIELCNTQQFTYKGPAASDSYFHFEQRICPKQFVAIVNDGLGLPKLK